MCPKALIGPVSLVSYKFSGSMKVLYRGHERPRSAHARGLKGTSDTVIQVIHGGYMEKDIESYLRKRVMAAGGLALKLVCPGFTGVPDRLILLPGGRICFAELKDTRRVPRKRQKRVHDIMRGLGFTVFVPDSRTAVDEMMREVMPNEVHTP